ncbi:MAG: dTDP-4-dehydrorhamnose 3,5-epimerase [Rhodospirillaceae bacterium]|jgi:dTDP-4-dehydrorhamnose 3,5-epimerase|nr:dTDP-4-dehydrorhamnose 3,5-epimerase [Rhodospirillaceae bacterium]MBT5242880.1 dTDP-4-dehydrorhamnose 3,5-epimerase [Rhodospirillaceae bacterium]MBT5563104.1 dTDP-4-dehydrorhamnose 3,5-epimerase [Rhodospirillaceae bacterium]MBT6243419.1 dTDP-4-dehydrorhamnose 3,5-epimerase [Rhodospirillaceae bacterium]MBT7138510.1 dTDP-4-dehydrorhamnose 3,5-epimerase [Rhodospirillaceae bacterium]
MKVEDTAIADVKIVHLTPFPDTRGMFVETFDTLAISNLGLDASFVQDATSVSNLKGTFRGLHFQWPPHAQATLVRVVCGRIFDVAVDIRESSPTYGKSLSVILDADDWRMLYLPRGLAHGFCTLEDNCHVAYKLGDHYAPGHVGGVQLDDPDLKIDWPIEPATGIISDKDRANPRLKDLATIFK